MGKKSGLVGVGLVLLATTGCVEAMNSGYPTTSYGYGYAPAYYNNGYYNNGYYNRSYYNNGYYSQPGYYRPAPTVITQTRYVPVPAPRHHHHGWDKNGDGVPDRWQRRW